MILANFLAALSFLDIVLGLGQKPTLSFSPDGAGLYLAGDGLGPTIQIASNDWPGVIRAAGDLAVDFGRVTGTNGTVVLSNSTAALDHPKTTGPVIIAGTIGNSSIIDELVSSSKIDVSQIKGKWESYSSQLVSHPMDGVSSALVIVGSDKRGTIYGLYDVSEQIGVSPWYWWADVPPKPKRTIRAMPVTKMQGPPSVKYRAIFINDEGPSLMAWASEKYGSAPNGNPGFLVSFHERLFELLLRLKANYYWPAMWDSMFYVDDLLNGPTAEKYGIVMGTSHTEPMARATNEQSLYMNGSWNWANNSANVMEFMAYGAERSQAWETIYSMGMRGLGDVSSPTLNASELVQIIDFQESLINNTFGSKEADIPRMWCLYKEVGGYYQTGMTVPENLVLLWTDDNVGNILRLPIANETQRSGGAGVYYHFDYVGSPRDYKWINSAQLEKTWQQMYLAYNKDASQIWVGNVGDMKANEIPLNHFLDMAYDMSQFEDPSSTQTWLKLWATREFGSSVAENVASIMDTYGKLIIRRKYELLDTIPFAYSLVNYDEAETVLQEWTTILNSAQDIYSGLDKATQASFFELVVHPILAGRTVLEIYTYAAFNALYASQGRVSTNLMANKVQSAYAADSSITALYEGLLDGKWNHIMDQVHLGYTTWSDPTMNIIPNVTYLSGNSDPSAGTIGVSVQGSSQSSLGNVTLTMKPMNPYMPSSESRYIEIYALANGTFNYKIVSSAPFVSLSPAKGIITAPGNLSDTRVFISVDWPKVPTGVTNVSLEVSSSAGTPTIIILPINKTVVPLHTSGFVESNGVVSMEAEHYQSATSGRFASYVTIPGFGRTLSGVTLMPVTCPSQTTATGPVLAYEFYTFTSASNASLTVYLGPALNTDPTRPLKYAFSVDDGAIQTTQPVPDYELGTTPTGWTDATESGSWIVMSSDLDLKKSGSHTLKVWALEPGLVIEKLVIDLGGVQGSYLGPPESIIV